MAGLPPWPGVQPLKTNAALAIVLNWLTNNCKGKDGEDLCDCIKKQYNNDKNLTIETVEKIAFAKIKKRNEPGSTKIFLIYLIEKHCYELIKTIINKISLKGQLTTDLGKELDESGKLTEMLNGAIMDDNLELFNFIVTLGINPIDRLDDAIAWGSIKVMKEIIRLGAGVNDFYKGQEPLFTAAVRPNFEEIIKYLIKNGAKVNGPDDKMMPMIGALRYETYITYGNVKTLLENKARIPEILPALPNVDPPIPAINTLEKIIRSGDLQMVKLLKKYGADTRNQCTLPDLSVAMRRLICPPDLRPKWYEYDIWEPGPLEEN